ncbi:hypothetical protein BDR07DRAFT_138743 [Suillus spraguei]|nr:hypothetical protein BDR07DRAFT_138743 [Suillus spraguei]
MPNNLMSDSNYSQSFTLNEEEQRGILQQRFPRAGYWFNMLPTHSFIHVVENMPPQQILTHLCCVPAPAAESAVCHCFRYHCLDFVEYWSNLGTSQSNSTSASPRHFFYQLLLARLCKDGTPGRGDNQNKMQLVKNYIHVCEAMSFHSSFNGDFRNFNTHCLTSIY